MLTASDIALQTYKDNKLLFGKMYFPEYFRKESPPFHLHIIKVTSTEKYVAIQAPRGGSKSTVETFLDTIHGVVMKRERFIIILQNTYAKAAATLSSIKTEFRFNKKLKADFGVDMALKDAEGDTIFRHPDGYTVRVLCKGIDQMGSIRGEKHGAWRPSLIIGDDMEDDELVKNPDRRTELEKQFNEVLKYCGDDYTRIVIIGTILHDDSLMAKLLSKDKFKNFRKLFYRAREDGESLWPQKWSLKDLEDMEADDPEGFAKEMQGDPSSGSLETVLRKDFRRWSIIEGQAVLYASTGEVAHRWDLKDCKAAIAVDMAWEEEQSSDDTAIVPGLVTPSNDLLVDTYVSKKGMRPDKFVEILFEMSARYQALTGRRVVIGFEKAKLEKVMKWFLAKAMREKNVWLWLKDVSWGNLDKVERILSRIANQYAAGAVYHREGMGVLENQLVRLRSVAHDDLADAVSMLPVLLEFSAVKKKQVVAEDKFKELQKHTAPYRKEQRRSAKYVFGNNKRPGAFAVKFAHP